MGNANGCVRLTRDGNFIFYEHDRVGRQFLTARNQYVSKRKSQSRRRVRAILLEAFGGRLRSILW